MSVLLLLLLLLGSCIVPRLFHELTLFDASRRAATPLHLLPSSSIFLRSYSTFYQTGSIRAISNSLLIYSSNGSTRKRKEK